MTDEVFITLLSNVKLNSCVLEDFYRLHNFVLCLC